MVSATLAVLTERYELVSSLIRVQHMNRLWITSSCLDCYNVISSVKAYIRYNMKA